MIQYGKSLRYHLSIIILQCRHGALYWLANYFIYTIRNGTVRRWRQRVTFGRLTLMFRFSLSGRSLQTRGLGRNFSLLLSLTHSAYYYHYYCTNQPAGRSFHFPNVVNRQTERNPCGKQRLRHCQLTSKTTTHPMNITDIDMYISHNHNS